MSEDVVAWEPSDGAPGQAPEGGMAEAPEGGAPELVDPVVSVRPKGRRNCTGCGKLTLAFQFMPGTDVCMTCVRAQAAAGTVVFPGVDVGAQLVGSAEARDWLVQHCVPPGSETPLSLEMVRAVVSDLLDERDRLLGQVVTGGQAAASGTLDPARLPLEVAAQALYLAAGPFMQEQLDGACEVQQLPLNRLILGVLARWRNDLLDTDMTFVQETAPAAQFGRGGGSTSGLSAGAGVGLAMRDASGQLQRQCGCCAVAFTPPRAQPNALYCGQECGIFADQIRIWATNATNHPEQADTPPPDPYDYFGRARRVEAVLAPALAFRERRMQECLTLARQQRRSYQGAA